LWAWLLGITAAKVAVAAACTGTVEVEQMANQAQAFLAGRDVLDRNGTYGNPSFFPMGHYGLVTGCWLLAQATGLSFAWLIKLPAIAADVVTAWALTRVPRGGTAAALAYMANPITFLLAGYHGQPHSVAVCGAVLALAAAEAQRPRAAGAVLALAASVRQHFAVLLWPLLLTTTRRIGMAATFAALAAIVNLPLLSFARPDRVLAPTWTYGSWGYTLLLLQGPRVLALAGWTTLAEAADRLNRAVLAIAPGIYLGWAAVFALWAWRRTRQDRLDRWHAALLFLLGVYTIAPGFGVQWLVWALPFWLVVDRRRALIYTALAGTFLAACYWQWTLNDAYGVRSITENLHVLSRADLAGILGVGALGVATWAYAARSAWQLWKSGDTLPISAASG
jgi:hypothetical protein